MNTTRATNCWNKLLASGYTKDQLLADTVAIVAQPYIDTLRTSMTDDELIDWAVGNAWREAYWDRNPNDKREIADDWTVVQFFAVGDVAKIKAAIHQIP